MDRIIEAFKNTETFRRITSDANTIMVYLGGSRALSMEDSMSDYDIVVLANFSSLEDWSKYFCLEMDGVRLHYYRMSPSSTLYNVSESIFLSGGVMLHFLKEDNILYINETHREVADKWVALSHDVAIVSSYKLFNLHRHDIEKAIISPKGVIYKRFYQICLSYYVLSGDPIDKSLLSKIKRHHVNEMSDEELQATVEILIKLKTFLEEHPIDVYGECTKLIDKIY